MVDEGHQIMNLTDFKEAEAVMKILWDHSDLDAPSTVSHRLWQRVYIPLHLGGITAKTLPVGVCYKVKCMRLNTAFQPIKRNSSLNYSSPRRRRKERM